MAAPYVVAAGAAAGAGSGNVTPGAPTCQAGDIIVVVAATWDFDPLTCTATGDIVNNSGVSGFETIFTPAASGDYSEHTVSAWAGRTTGGSPGTITVGSGENTIVTRAFSIRGAPSSGAFLGTDFGATAGILTSGSQRTDITFSSLTTTLNEELVILVAAISDNVVPNAWNDGDLTPDQSYSGSEGGGSDAAYAVLFGSLAAAGSIGSPEFTLPSAEWWDSIRFTIKAATAAASKVPVIDNAYRQRRAA